MSNTSEKTKRLITVALMAALVFIFTYIHIDIPTPLGKTMLHLGNMMCLLSGLLFGGVPGGLAAGFGSMFFDVFDPVYLPECWVTFIMKFCMGFIAGILAHKAFKKLKHGRFALSAAIAAVAYTCLYLTKTLVVNKFILGVEWETVLATLITKGTVSGINAVIAAVCAVLLNAGLRPALQKAGLLEKLGIRD